MLNSTTVQFNSAIIGGGVRVEQGSLSNVHWDNYSKINMNSAEIYGSNVIARLTKREIYINDVIMVELGSDYLYLIN